VVRLIVADNVELKPAISGSVSADLAAINRTTVELKLTIHREAQRWKYPINRTTVELKHELLQQTNPQIQLLIEPLWN